MHALMSACIIVCMRDTLMPKLVRSAPRLNLIFIPNLSSFVSFLHFNMPVSTAAEKRQIALLVKRASLEQALRSVRMELKDVAVVIHKERKAKLKTTVITTINKQKAVREVPRLHKCPKTGGMVGMAKDGNTIYGPGHDCWQCMHRARGGKGGHKHTCGKTPYGR